MTEPGNSFSPNLILQTMHPDTLELLKPHLEHVEIAQGEMLSPANKPIEHIYFPEGGIVSITADTVDTSRTEVGIVGIDGFTGTAVLLGSDQSPHDTFVQVDGGTSYRIGADTIRRFADENAPLRTLMLRYVQSFMVQLAHSAVCNAHYRVEARLSRWLVMCHDRVPDDEIIVTHEFISMMIAAQRPGVTETLHVLEGEGLIRSTRGRVTVLDRARLEAFAQDAYGKPEAEYRRLIGPFGKSARTG